MNKKLAKSRKKREYSDSIFNVVMYILFTLVCILCFYPFYHLMINTISDNKLVELGKVIFYPKGIHFGNYISVFKLDNLFNATTVTLARTGLSVVVNVLVTSYAAYVFTKTVMWKRKFWYRLVVTTMYFSAGLIPGYLNIRMLGLLNSFWVYIIPGMVSVYNMVLVKTFIESIPESLEESAQLDGAGYLTRFFRIILPLTKPILATISLFVMVSEWNDFFTTKLYITKPKLYTLQFLLYEYLQQINAAQSQMDGATDEAISLATQANATTVRLTLTAVVTIPIMCVYPFIQKYYVKGIMVGSVKG